MDCTEAACQPQRGTACGVCQAGAAGASREDQLRASGLHRRRRRGLRGARQEANRKEFAATATPGYDAVDPDSTSVSVSAPAPMAPSWS